ncbi:MAG: hypothetical protein M0P49_01885 [Bacilli bacterium]|nr:hypothetical protein [Bacilli bacterium]
MKKIVKTFLILLFMLTLSSCGGSSSISSSFTMINDFTKEYVSTHFPAEYDITIEVKKYENGVLTSEDYVRQVYNSTGLYHETKSNKSLFLKNNSGYDFYTYDTIQNKWLGPYTQENDTTMLSFKTNMQSKYLYNYQIESRTFEPLENTSIANKKVIMYSYSAVSYDILYYIDPATGICFEYEVLPTDSSYKVSGLLYQITSYKTAKIVLPSID